MKKIFHKIISNEWIMLWIVYGVMAAAILFQMFYIQHLKSELKLFQKDGKNQHTKSR